MISGCDQSARPLVETYIQETPEGSDASARPTKDHYFLGRVPLERRASYTSRWWRVPTLPRRNPVPGCRSVRARRRIMPLTFLPRGFAQMAVIDLHDFNRQTYRFEYVRREFLGEVRCLVFDVAPLDRQQAGKFVGRDVGGGPRRRDCALQRHLRAAAGCQERSRRTLFSFR